MKFTSNLIFAALAVTAANAGNLRAEDEDPATPVGGYKGTGTGDDYNPLDDDDLIIDLTDLFGTGSRDDEEHVKINILSLIGDGSGQIPLDNIIEAFGDEAHSGYGGFPWAKDTDDDDDYTGIKGDGTDDYGLSGKGVPGTNGGWSAGAGPTAQGDLSWLLDGSNALMEDPVLTKGGAKGDSPIFDDSTVDDYPADDPIGGKGAATKGGLFGDDDDDLDDSDPLLGASKNPTSKSGDYSWLVDDLGDDDDSIMTKGGKGAFDDDDLDDDPILTKGGKGGFSPDDDDDLDDDPILTKGGKGGFTPEDDDDLDDDPILTKGGKGGFSPVDDDDLDDDPILTKGGKGGFTPEDDDDLDDDPIMSKGTTSGKSISTLDDDVDDDVDDLEDPILVKGATNDYNSAVQKDLTAGAHHHHLHHLQTDLDDEDAVATKGSKTLRV